MTNPLNPENAEKRKKLKRVSLFASIALVGVLALGILAQVLVGQPTHGPTPIGLPTVHPGPVPQLPNMPVPGPIVSPDTRGL